MKKQYSIGIVQPELIYPRGAERQVCELARHLTDLGNRVTIYTFHKSYPYTYDYLLNNVEIIDLGQAGYIPIQENMHGYLSRLAHFVKLQFQNYIYIKLISTKLKKHDFINAHNYPASWISYFTDIPVIWTCNEPPYWYYASTTLLLDFFFFPYKLFDKLLTKKIKAIFVLDSRIWRLVSRGYPKIKSYIIGSGAGLYKKIEHIDNGILDVIFVGELNQQKRPLDVLRALSLIKDRTFKHHVHMVGVGVQHRKLKEYSDVNSLRCTFYGRVENDTLYKLYSLADIAVFVPENQPWGIFPLETLLAGIPTILSNECGILDVVGKYFIPAVNVGDIRSLSESILKIYNSISSARKKFHIISTKLYKRINWLSYSKVFLKQSKYVLEIK